MTAEIAILNKEAIALASDSAVTIGQGDKIYNSANKIFTISKFNPVGIMIFGNATFMGIPWETLIKDFRRKLHDKCFNNLSQYADFFIKYLEGNDSDITLDMQKDYVAQVIGALFIEIRNRLINNVEDILKEKEDIVTEKIGEELSKLIEEYHKKFSDAPDLLNLPEGYLGNLKKHFEEGIKIVIKQVFEKLILTPENVQKLLQISYFAFTKGLFRDATSGIVITGFGDKEIYPSLISYNMESVILNKVKFKELEHLKVDSKGAPFIAPYAQSEMVQAFIRGIDPEYRIAIEDFVKLNFEKFSESIVDNLGKLKEEDSPEKERIKQELKKIVKEITKNFKDQTESYSRDNHINTILSSVAVLPKDELANMAEAFINLTSFKRRVSLDQKETVGGPVDVAVISKGDGFIWIRRKHYFKPELNQHFLRNYYNKKLEIGECNEEKK